MSALAGIVRATEGRRDVQGVEWLHGLFMSFVGFDRNPRMRTANPLILGIALIVSIGCADGPEREAELERPTVQEIQGEFESRGFAFESRGWDDGSDRVYIRGFSADRPPKVPVVLVVEGQSPEASWDRASLTFNDLAPWRYTTTDVQRQAGYIVALVSLLTPTLNMEVDVLRFLEASTPRTHTRTRRFGSVTVDDDRRQGGQTITFRRELGR